MGENGNVAYCGQLVDEMASCSRLSDVGQGILVASASAILFTGRGDLM